MDVEVKVLVAGEHWAKIKSRIPADVDEKKREVWFFETSDLALKQHEVVLRVRVNRKKGMADATAKQRRWVSPFVSVREAWEQLPGFKSEIDASLTEGVPAWSITAEDLEEDSFRAATENEEGPREFFTKPQRLLVESAWPLMPWDKLKARGPIASVQWKLADGFAIERWTVGEESVVELSKRGTSQDAALDEIRRLLSADGLEAQSLEGGKTAWALTRLVR